MKFMKLALIGCMAALTIMAADATGKWTGEMQGRNGTRTVTISLKADGDKLSGTVGGQMGDTEITDGKVDGDSVMFNVVREFNGNKMTSHYAGKVEGDTIHFTIKMEGGSGNMPDRKLEAHRSTT